MFSATTPSQECLRRDVQAGPEMSTFNSRLLTGTVPRFNFIIPNGCEDALGNCAPIDNRYTQFDDFLAREVPLIQASPPTIETPSSSCCSTRTSAREASIRRIR